jgi:hypothetical protein
MSWFDQFARSRPMQEGGIHRPGLTASSALAGSRPGGVVGELSFCNGSKRTDLDEAQGYSFDQAYRVTIQNVSQAVSLEASQARRGSR